VRPAEAAAKLGVPFFLLQRLENQTKLHTAEGLVLALARILEADLSIKRGEHDDETALQLLIFDLAGMAQPTRPADRRGYSRPRAAPGPPRSGRARA
jgi:hypothetical protein